MRGECHFQAESQEQWQNCPNGETAIFINGQNQGDYTKVFAQDSPGLRLLYNDPNDLPFTLEKFIFNEESLLIVIAKSECF